MKKTLSLIVLLLLALGMQAQKDAANVHKEHLHHYR